MSSIAAAVPGGRSRLSSRKCLAPRAARPRLVLLGQLLDQPVASVERRPIADRPLGCVHKLPRFHAIPRLVSFVTGVAGPLT